MLINDNRYLKSVKFYNFMAFRRDFNEPVEEDKTSRINAAGIINISLENLWRDAYSALSKGNLVLWNRKLDSIWIILGGDVKKGSEEDIKYDKMDLQLYLTGSLNHKTIGFEKHTPNESINMAKQYLLLKEKSLFLRRLQNSQGKGTAYLDERDDDFD
jgi:hypothetical protein